MTTATLKKGSEVEEMDEAVPAKTGPMADLFASATKPPVLDDVVEGPVIAVGRARIFVDLQPFGTDRDEDVNSRL